MAERVRKHTPVAAAADMPLVRVTDLARYFDVSKPWLNRVLEREPRQTLRAVDGVSFDIPKGKTFSLVGESGCGKSTVARTVVGLYRPTKGQVFFEGREISRFDSRQEMRPYRSRIQMIFQDPYASLNPRWRVKDIVAEPIRAENRLAGKALDARVGELLKQVKLSPSDGMKYPHEFSGGQRQRISIARALASEAEFLVCDEPTSALDVSVQAQILNLMKELQRTFALTYLFISHNLAVVYHVSDWVGVMYLGRLVEWAEKRTLFRYPRHPYTRMLLDTIPDLDMSGRERAPVAGEVPNPINPPSGCPFHPRCPHANERCKAELPRSLPTPEGAFVACHAVEEGRLPVEKRDYALPRTDA
ncbi:MAG: ATP-binding cassette domain-containing protein [Azospirillaceae bacterium]